MSSKSRLQLHQLKSWTFEFLRARKPNNSLIFRFGRWNYRQQTNIDFYNLMMVDFFQPVTNISQGRCFFKTSQQQTIKKTNHPVFNGSILSRWKFRNFSPFPSDSPTSSWDLVRIICKRAKRRFTFRVISPVSWFRQDFVRKKTHGSSLNV